MPGELEHIDPRELEKAITKWACSVCQICGKKYLHSRFYQPETCQSRECITALKERLENQKQ
jgi:hypothetical protein